jgi:limonene-1,2-epoxide hydrolase
MSAGAELATRFIDAFNDRDPDAFVATLDPDVEIHASRGLRRGIDEARAWATRAPGGVQQAIEVEDLREGDDCVVALIVRRWHWDDPEHAGVEAGADEMAWLFELRDGRIRSWRPFDDRAVALGAAGLDSEA